MHLEKTLIHFPEGCRSGLFLERIKRFTVRIDDAGEELLGHTNNTGTMLGLVRPGSRALLSPATNPNRKLRWTLEALDFHGIWVGVNTGTPNKMLKLAWEAGLLPETEGYTTFRSEAKVGDSRLDGLFEGPQGRLWVECKNVTLVEDDAAQFPDAVTTRGQKHLRELMDLAAKGDRVALFFLVQRSDGNCFTPADVIDPDYAELFWQAVDVGVEVWPYRALVSEQGIALGDRLDVFRPGEYRS